MKAASFQGEELHFIVKTKNLHQPTFIITNNRQTASKLCRYMKKSGVIWKEPGETFSHDQTCIRGVPLSIREDRVVYGDIPYKSSYRLQQASACTLRLFQSPHFSHQNILQLMLSLNMYRESPCVAAVILHSARRLKIMLIYIYMYTGTSDILKMNICTVTAMYVAPST